MWSSACLPMITSSCRPIPSHSDLAMSEPVYTCLSLAWTFSFASSPFSFACSPYCLASLRTSLVSSATFSFATPTASPAL